MTTLLLPPDEVAKIRALKGLSYILAVMILLDRHHPGRGFQPKEVALIAGMDERTAAKQLQDLSVLDRAILTGAGYVLTNGGRAMFLAPAADDEALALRPELALPVGQALSPVSKQALQAQAHQIIGLQSETAISESESSTHTARALEVEEVNTLTISKDSSTTTYLDSRKARALTNPQVFRKSHLLFGESVLVRKDVGAEHAVSVFAHVYANRDKFRFPARVAFSMMRDGKEPREEFVQDPWRHLPTDYLEALGIIWHCCNSCPSLTFTTSEELDAHMQAVHPPKFKCDECELEFEGEGALSDHYHRQHVPDVGIAEVDESVNKPLPNSHMTPAQAWQSVLGQLQMELPRASFDTWVRDTRAIRYESNTLTIGVRNSYARDWLESRLASTVSRLMVGIMNQSVDVEFIVAPLSKQEDL